MISERSVWVELDFRVYGPSRSLYGAVLPPFERYSSQFVYLKPNGGCTGVTLFELAPHRIQQKRVFA